MFSIILRGGGNKLPLQLPGTHPLPFFHFSFICLGRPEIAPPFFAAAVYACWLEEKKFFLFLLLPAVHSFAHAIRHLTSSRLGQLLARRRIIHFASAWVGRGLVRVSESMPSQGFFNANANIMTFVPPIHSHSISFFSFHVSAATGCPFCLRLFAWQSSAALSFIH